MGKTKRLKIGSKLIEKGKTYRVFKIKKKKIEDKYQRIIYYKPFFKNSLNESIVCSIPESSIINAHIRKPVSKDKIDEVLTVLSKRIRERQPLDIIKAKDILNSDDIFKTAKILKRYWKAQKREGEALSKSKKDVLNLAIDRIVEEVALVSGISLSKAKDKIIAALNS